MSSDVQTALKTRILDQLMLDEDVLIGVCRAQSDHASELSRFERKLALRRFVKTAPMIGPTARRLYLRLVGRKRFGR